ncbi:MAG: TetR/AcrR family transcriptional regulator [Acidimicrobiales bacterium]|nr:TetR/AcrR family transcriptional regulator [Acidimicrobiales bacterium]
MATTTRTRTPSTEMADLLLEAAADLLEREGPEALSVRRIAAAAGVAPMGVYNHFSSKSGIIEALFVQGFERLGAAMSTLRDVDDPLEAMSEGCRRYRALALAHPRVYELMFLAPVPGFAPSDAAMMVALAAFEGLVSAVRRAMAAGALAVDDPTTVAQMVWSAIHGWMALELADMSFVADQDAAADRLSGILLRGLAP